MNLSAVSLVRAVCAGDLDAAAVLLDVLEETRDLRLPAYLRLLGRLVEAADDVDADDSVLGLEDEDSPGEEDAMQRLWADEERRRQCSRAWERFERDFFRLFWRELPARTAGEQLRQAARVLGIFPREELGKE